MPKQSDIFFAGGAGAIAVNGFDGIWKTYTEADVTVTSTATNFNLYAGDNHFKPYKDKNGNWFLDFIIAASQDAIGSHTMTIHGADAKPTTGSQDASAVYLDQQGLSGSGCKAYSDGAGNTAILHYLGGSTARTRVSGTVALTSKPTWADFNPEASVLVSTKKPNTKVEAGTISTTIITTPDSWTDITGATIDLTEGTWMIGFGCSFYSGATTAHTAAIRTSGNVVVPKTDAYAWIAAGTVQHLSMTTFVEVGSSGETYKLSGRVGTGTSSRIYGTDVGITGSLNDGPDGTINLWAMRLIV